MPPDPKLKAGVDVLLGVAPLLPPKLKVELGADTAGARLLAPKLPPKLGMLEAPKPIADELAGADAVLLCPKAKDGVLAAAGAEVALWVA